MKKLLSILIFILMIATAIAQVEPTPVIGKLTINGVTPTGYQIEVKNLDNPNSNIITSKELGSLITENGMFVFDLGYLGEYDPASRRYAGDRLQVKIVKDGKGNDVSCSQCIHVLNIPNRFPHTFEMKVVDSTVQVIEKEVVVEKEVIVTETEIVPGKTIIQCQDGTLVYNINECLETKEQVLGYTKTQLGVAGAISAGFAGLVVYYIMKKQRKRAKKMLDTRIKKLKK